jgi:hypothetical protein
MHGRPGKGAETILFSIRDKCQHSLIVAWAPPMALPLATIDVITDS